MLYSKRVGNSFYQRRESQIEFIIVSEVISINTLWRNPSPRNNIWFKCSNVQSFQVVILSSEIKIHWKTLIDSQVLEWSGCLYRLSFRQNSVIFKILRGCPARRVKASSRLRPSSWKTSDKLERPAKWLQVGIARALYIY